jgi:DNA-binding transcriptional MocR family regulator
MERWRGTLEGDDPSRTGSMSLARVIRVEIERGVLPSGAVLPPPERVARALGFEVRDARAAYAELGSAGLIREPTHGMAVVGDGEPWRRS